jgi:hypothetical protein
MQPVELDYYHRALTSAQAEVARILQCFDADDRAEAARIALGSSDAAKEAELASEQRSRAVTDAILALPNWRGTALTRGDLQAQLDNAWREALATGRTTLPDAEQQQR